MAGWQCGRVGLVDRVSEFYLSNRDVVRTLSLNSMIGNVGVRRSTSVPFDSFKLMNKT